LDLLYGLPTQSLDKWRITLEKALELEPEHLSLYALTLDENVPLAQWIASGKLPAPDEDLTADMYCLAEEMLEKAGYEHYEISNWAKPGFASRHNIRYWLNLPYLGFGAGAHSFWRGMRWHNVMAPEEYICILSSAEASGFPSPVAREVETITLRIEMAETIILGLRLVKEGLSFERFYNRFGQDLRELYGSQIEELVSLGLLEKDGERIRLSPRGRLLGNEVFQRFL
ncbi:MAG: coproporphyrinogen III oxidase family protein, partial [Anaerolineae bacterium]|nr:coproporphyrinogen III oxidase family protein [Anaerolineae bacterium]